MKQAIRESSVRKYVLTAGLALVFCASLVSAKTAESEELTLDDIRAFSEAFSRIKQDYVEDISDRVLMEKAIRGMVRGLDDYSRYLSEDAFRSLENTTGGRVGDIGVKLESRSGELVLVEAEDPAGAAGLAEGDRVVALNNIPLGDLSLARAHQILQGPVGQPVKLKIKRRGISIDLEFEVERQLRDIPGVNYEMLDPELAYIQISSFQTNTLDHVAQALEAIRLKQAKPRGLILDLRGNPGGVLAAAVSVADLFLAEGTIVFTRGRATESQIHHVAGESEEFPGTPLVMLVDKVTASAAEILVGALQDHDRGQVLGDQTFGKGSVQTIMPLVNGSAVKLTTAHYFTPKGRSIQATGITPDISLDADFNAPAQGPGLPGDRALTMAIALLRGEFVVGRAEPESENGE